MNSYSGFYKYIVQYFWLVWLLTVVFVFIVFSISIDKGAYLHSDELVIIDLGNNILSHDPNSSIAWIIGLQQPAFLFSYIGVSFQELAYRYIGEFGPRILSLLGAIAAATSFVGWLKRSGINTVIVFLLGLVFLFDPLIVQGFTIGRIDGWAMFFCLSSCWIIRDIPDCGLRTICTFPLICAGALTTLAFLTWPSAIFLYPLIALELVRLVINTRKNREDFHEPFKLLGIFIIGVVISSILLLIPVSGQIISQLNLVKETITANTHSGSSGVIGFQSFFSNLIELLRILKFSPFIVLFGIISIFKLRQNNILFAIIVVVVTMAFTLVYINRVQYLVPYFIVAISLLFYKGYHHRFSRGVRIGSIVILLFWSLGLSLGVRTYLAFEGQDERDRTLLIQAAQTMVGAGENKVYIPYEFYYSGRTLNWRMYRAYLAHNNTMDSENWKKMISRVDYIIMREYSVGFERETINEGFVDKGIFHLYEDPPVPFNGITDNEVRIRNLFSIFRKPYGPYRLYVRE